VRNVRVGRRRGEPLLALAVILAGWVAVRAAVWEVRPLHSVEEVNTAARTPGENPVALAESDLLAPTVAPTLLPAQESPWLSSLRTPRPATFDPPFRQAIPGAVTPLIALPAPMPPVAPGLAGGHAMLWLAGVSRLPMPAALLAAQSIPQAPALPAGTIAPRSEPASPRRWSGDGWALFRAGRGSPALGGIGATYGASQIGAVLRYRLIPTSPHRPTAYVRATAALNGSGEREAAAGVSLRPIPKLPVSLSGEARIGRFGGETIVRPAAMAVTELAPVGLPAGVRGEFYLQGGYVGGRGATAFIDGAARLDKQLARLGPVELRAGAGAWGGAPKGAERIDIGPTATLGVAKGSAAARIALDWRFRVAGDASPKSGLALTVSAGF